ncbi:MAG: Amylo-alpha6-glucosidase [Herbaspirillum sp.]|jgi:glycogen debranching enzyme|nr:Amylo-alpha6-glucosidase [Herbaspirillum sp.]
MTDQSRTDQAERDAETPQAESAGTNEFAADTRRLFVLKEGDAFIVADANGDITGQGDGLFYNDTRLLSQWKLLLGGKPASLLSSDVSRDNTFFTAHSTNHPLPPLGDSSTPTGVIHVERKRFLWDARLFERIRLTSYGGGAKCVPLTIRYAADFRDMFEVRGQKRPGRGTLSGRTIGKSGIELRYLGLDGKSRSVAMSFSHRPTTIDAESAGFNAEIAEHRPWELYIEVGTLPARPGPESYRRAAARARLSLRRRRQRGAGLHASGRLFQAWLDKSKADLAMLTSDLSTGPYPYAGIPWFSTPFGRDAIITSLQTLWIDPGLARGVLAYLAKNQAHETSTFRDSEPGKIMHETRKGEMAETNELPFGKYYGGVDTTPLFVMLAGAFARRTGDMAAINELWPALEAATGWMESNIEQHGNGFLCYSRGEQSGLVNQGWKDSHDAISHADGSMPEGPIALVEVQGYACQAFQSMAGLAKMRGDISSARDWMKKASTLATAVEERFWMEEEAFYALALDGHGNPCRVRASNAGHLLFTELPREERGRAVSAQLLSRSFNSGWGLRTLAPEAPRFNPMSYHNGSVWPHDIALCAAGMARYGERDGVISLMGQMFECAAFAGMRLPELFCGFARESGEAPIAYPVACLPQAWAAGSVFMMLQACLGLSIDIGRRTIVLNQPRLPEGIEGLRVSRLVIATQEVDLHFRRSGHLVTVVIERQAGTGKAVHIEVVY